MRKRGALARALVLDPDVVFCDEPSSGLDPITSSRLDDLLLRLKETFGMTLVVVTHELRSIERVADQVLVLNDGRPPFRRRGPPAWPRRTTSSSGHSSSGRIQHDDA